MTLSEAMKEIESHRFAARLNIASNLRTFLEAAKHEEAVTVLSQALETPDSRSAVLLRTLELSRHRVDLRYENQWDTALAVYVWLMSSKDRGITSIMAEAAAHAPQCWWATRLARDVLLEGQARNNAGVEEHDFTPLPSVKQFSDAGEVVLSAGFVLDIREALELFVAEHDQTVKPDVVQKWSMIQTTYGVGVENPLVDTIAA